MADGCIQVTAGVLVRAGSVLVCQRAAHGHHPGKWEFPGGKVEPGESAAAGIRRELREELGIDATVGAVLWRTRHRYAERDPIELTFFRIPEYVGTTENRIFAALAWVPIGELTGVDFLDADREFVAALARDAVVLD